MPDIGLEFFEIMIISTGKKTTQHFVFGETNVPRNGRVQSINSSR